MSRHIRLLRPVTAYDGMLRAVNLERGAEFRVQPADDNPAPATCLVTSSPRPSTELLIAGDAGVVFEWIADRVVGVVHVVAIGQNAGLALERFLARRPPTDLDAAVLVASEDELPAFRRARWYHRALRCDQRPPLLKHLAREFGTVGRDRWQAVDTVVGLATPGDFESERGVEHLLASADHVVAHAHYAPVEAVVEEEAVGGPLLGSVGMFLPGIIGSSVEEYCLLRLDPKTCWGAAGSSFKLKDPPKPVVADVLRSARRRLKAKPSFAFLHVSLSAEGTLRQLEMIVRALVDALDGDVPVEFSADLLLEAERDIEIAVTLAGQREAARS